MLKIGVSLKDLGPSERNFMFMAQLDKMTSTEVDTRVFYQNLEPLCINPAQFALMPMSEMFGFQNGVLITTDIDTTLFAVNAAISSKIIFYVDDIEWMRTGKQNYLYNLRAYQSKYCTIICKSYDYARYLNNYANVPSKVVEHYNLEGILKNGYFQNNSIIR